MKVLFVSLVFLVGCAASRVAVTPDASTGQDRVLHDYMVSRMSSYQGDLPGARRYLSQVLEKDPDHAALWFDQAVLRAAEGDLAGAEEDCRKGLERAPDDVGGLTLLGRFLQGQGRASEAEPYLERAFALAPSEELLYHLAELYLSQQKNVQAVTFLESWIRGDPDPIPALFYLASIYQGILKDENRAVSVYRRILQWDPTHEKVLENLASIYLNQKKEALALKTLEILRAAHPDDLAIQLKIALIYYEAKRYEEAIGIFQGIIRRYPAADRVIYYLGVIFENVKRDEEAIREFAKIDEGSEYFKDATLHQAFLHHRGKRDAAAVQLLESGLKTRHREEMFYEYLAQIHSDRREFPLAIEVLRRGIRHCKEKEPLHYALGLVYDRQGRYEDGIRVMRQVLKINPNNAQAMNFIGYTYADRRRLDKLDEALSMIQKALLIKPDDGFITDSLGWVYFRKGDLEQAYLQILKAYELAPKEPTITEHLGDVVLEQEDPLKALKYYEESLAILTEKDQDEQTREDRERLKKKIEAIQADF